MTHHDDTLSHLRRLIEGERVAMMTSVDREHQLRGRPMTLLELDDHGRFWFFCEDNADNADLLEVHLAFSDEKASTYVSVFGQACLTRDRSTIHRLWSPMARPWFPEGPDSAGIALLSVQPSHIEYWDAPDNRVMRSVALLASVMTRKPMGLGRHGVLPTSGFGATPGRH